MEAKSIRLAPRVAIALSTVLLAAVMLVCIPQGQAQAVEADGATMAQATLHTFSDSGINAVQDVDATPSNNPKQAGGYKSKYGLLAKNGVLYPCTKKGKKLGKSWRSGSTVRHIFVASNVKTVKKLNNGMKYWSVGTVKAKVQKVTFLLNKKKKSSVKKISADFMKGHSYLKKVKNFNRTKVASIGSYAFAGTSITSLSMPKSLKTIGKCAFLESKIKTVRGLGKTALTTIGESAFESSKLTSIVLPKSLKTIAKYAFYDAKNLASIGGLQNTKVAAIGEQAFWGCGKLKSVSLPVTCKSIAPGAFYNCTSLATLKIPANMVVPYSTNPIYNTKIYNKAAGACIYVPANRVAEYQVADYWWNLASVFKPI